MPDNHVPLEPVRPVGPGQPVVSTVSLLVAENARGEAKVPNEVAVHISIITGLVVLAVVAAAGVIDVFLGGWYGEAATISAQVRSWCQRWPILYVLMAWLLFHLTLPPCPPKS